MVQPRKSRPATTTTTTTLPHRSKVSSLSRHRRQLCRVRAFDKTSDSFIKLTPNRAFTEACESTPRCELATAPP